MQVQKTKIVAYPVTYVDVIVNSGLRGYTKLLSLSKKYPFGLESSI